MGRGIRHRDFYWLSGRRMGVSSAAGTVTVMAVEFTEDGTRMLDPKFTSAPGRKPVPVIVRETRFPLPTNAMGGESRVMVSGAPESRALSVNDAALLLTPCADALICVVPSPTAVARPFASMVATVGSLDVQLNTTPLMASPF